MSVHNGTTHESSNFTAVKGIEYDWMSLVVATSSDLDAELAELIMLEGAN